MLMPVAALLAAMVCLQFGASYATRLFASVGAQGTTALRLGIASIMLAIALRPWRARLPVRAVGGLIGYGVALGCMNLLFYLSLRTVPLGIAVALEFLGPLALTLRHSTRALHAVWLALAVCGLGLLLPIWHGAHPVGAAGAACALGAGGFWACYMIFGARAGAALGTRAAALGTPIAALLVLPIGAAHAGVGLLAPAVLAQGMVVALFSSALPYSLEMVALTRLSPRMFGTLTSLEPGVGALMGWALLGQRLTERQWCGIAAITLAAAGAVLVERRPPPAIP